MRLLCGFRRLLVGGVVLAVASGAGLACAAPSVDTASPSASSDSQAAPHEPAQTPASPESAPVQPGATDSTTPGTPEAAPAAAGAAVSAPAQAAAPAANLLSSLHPKTELTVGERTLRDTKDNSFLDPMSWNVTAYKGRHQLLVYYKGRLFRTYPAVFGRNGHGAKLWEGDLRTPEGVYWIVKKHDSRRWKRFMRLNYPNFVDRRRWGEMAEAGVVPLRDGHPRALGGAIGIHGTDEPRFNRWNIDWTAGCISVDNDAIFELDRLLPIGTIVIIKP